jgi:prolipoprotein diacylglyceryltransferase
MKDKKFEQISLFVVIVCCIMNICLSIKSNNDSAFTGWVVAFFMTMYGYIPFIIEKFNNVKKNDKDDLNIS